MQHHYILRRHKDKLGNSLFDIENPNLIYVDMTPTHTGLQCNHVGDTTEYNQIRELCKELVTILKKIDQLNTVEPESMLTMTYVGILKEHDDLMNQLNSDNGLKKSKQSEV